MARSGFSILHIMVICFFLVLYEYCKFFLSLLLMSYAAWYARLKVFMFIRLVVIRVTPNGTHGDGSCSLMSSYPDTSYTAWHALFLNQIVKINWLWLLPTSYATWYARENSVKCCHCFTSSATWHALFRKD